MREESLTSNSLGIPADSNRPGNPLVEARQALREYQLAGEALVEKRWGFTVDKSDLR